jgi:hypothetical protein
MVLVTAGVGTAGRDQQILMCGGEPLTLTVTTTTNDHSVAYGVGTISGGMHLIPTSFSGTLTDLTTSTVLFTFSQSKGKGHGMHNQTSITCTQVEPATTAGALGIPGVAPTDVVQFSLVVTAVLKP